MNNTKQENQKGLSRLFTMEMPHTYLLIFAILVICALLTYVIPAGHSEQAHSLEGIGTDCPLNAEGGPGINEMPDIASGPGFAGTSGVSDPLAERSADEPDRSHLRGRLNLLNWNGKGKPTGLFPTADGPAGA